jgi:hypothetical protein
MFGRRVLCQHVLTFLEDEEIANPPAWNFKRASDVSTAILWAVHARPRMWRKASQQRLLFLM